MRTLGIMSLIGLSLCGFASGAVTLPPVFSDHMVLQSGMPVPVWGTAAPGDRVSVRFADRMALVKADTNGVWRATLKRLKPSAQPRELVVAVESGKPSDTVIIHDVLVGEVWHTSGQSNMKMRLNQMPNKEAEIAAANAPLIRYLVPGESGWQPVAPAMAARDFSALAYFFAKHIQGGFQCPVGIIDSSVAGAVAQRFISPEALAADRDLLAGVKAQRESLSDIYLEKIGPVAPFAVRGVLWCQGEGNRDYPATYRRLLKALIADWRAKWERKRLPFIIVQLANFGKKAAQPQDGRDVAIRDVQFKTVCEVPDTALVVTIDLGLETDVHYPNKRDVAWRSWQAARALAYGERVESSGPMFERAVFKDGRAIVFFRHRGKGLVAKGGGALQGFLLCGEDKVFVRANAEIRRDRVIVSSSGVPVPVAVRYDWERNPDGNLWNEDGLPASPFRSDAYENYFTRDDSPKAEAP